MSSGVLKKLEYVVIKLSDDDTSVLSQAAHPRAVAARVRAKATLIPPPPDSQDLGTGPARCPDLSAATQPIRQRRAAADIGQAKVPTGVTVCQPGVIQAEEREDRSV